MEQLHKAAQPAKGGICQAQLRPIVLWRRGFLHLCPSGFLHFLARQTGDFLTARLTACALTCFMPFFFFGEGKPPSLELELLGMTSRSDVADEVYDNYRWLASEQAAPKIAIVEAANAEEAKAKLETEDLVFDL